MMGMVLLHAAADDDVEYPSYDCGGEWRLNMINNEWLKNER